MALVGVHHLALSVRDRDKSQAFDEGVLGFAAMMELEETGHDGASHRVLLLKHPDSTLVIGLHQHANNAGEPFSEFATGMDHIALAVDTSDALEAWEKRFADAGVEHSPIAPGQRPGATILVFRDPDNIQLQFIHFPITPSSQ
jgi:catechol 2,3-dioxygenase-like lactoylglutathione lyase family enzyme